MKKIIMYAAFVLFAAVMAANAEASIGYAKKGLVMCYEIIIPSLFPFFVCAGLLTYSGFANVLSALFTPLMKPLFNINGSGAAAFVLGIISGYPLGASTACSLYQNNYLSKTETERLLAFCNNSGPLFILGSVGIALYKSPSIGWSLYAAHILAALTVGVIFRFYKKNKYLGYQSRINHSEQDIGRIFSAVIQNSVKSIMLVCGTVVFFSVIANMAAELLPGGVLSAVFKGIIEFVTGVTGIYELNISLVHKLALSSFVVGFAGISVHMQVMSVVSGCGLSLKPYIIGKLMHGIFAGAYTLIIFGALPPMPAFRGETSAPDINGAFAMSALYVMSAAAAILIICGIYQTILKIRHTKKEPAKH